MGKKQSFRGRKTTRNASLFAMLRTMATWRDGKDESVVTSNAYRGRECWKLRTSASEMCAVLTLPLHDCTHTLPGGGGKEEGERKRRERESFGRYLKLTGITHLSLEVIDECSEVFHKEWPGVDEKHSVHHYHHQTVAAENNTLSGDCTFSNTSIYLPHYLCTLQQIDFCRHVSNDKPTWRCRNQRAH